MLTPLHGVDETPPPDAAPAVAQHPAKPAESVPVPAAVQNTSAPVAVSDPVLSLFLQVPASIAGRAWAHIETSQFLQVPEPAVVLPPMSARQSKAVGAWNAHRKEVDKHFVSFFEGVERDVAQVCSEMMKCFLLPAATQQSIFHIADATHTSCEPHQVDKGIQGSAFAARETHKNVGIAKAYLSHISQALDNVDTLVVPIVLQRDGNF